MEKYIKFYEKYGPGKFYGSIDLDVLEFHDQYLLTDEIIELLKNEGISSYANGLLWTLNPSEYLDWLNDWLPFDDRSVPFARSAFGDILFIREQQIMALNSSKGFMSVMTDVDDIDSFINRYLTDSWFYNTFFNADIFNQIEDKNLSKDECFGFQPLLSLGGNRDVKSLKKVAMREHLAIISSSSDVVFYEH